MITFKFIIFIISFTLAPFIGYKLGELVYKLIHKDDKYD